MPMLLVLRSKAYFYSRLIAGVADSNPAKDMEVRLFSLCAM